MTWHRRSNNKRKQRIYQSFQEKISFENNFPRPQRTYSKTPSSVFFKTKGTCQPEKFPMEINTPAIVYMTKLFRCLPKREKGWSQFRCERNILRIAAKNHINHIIIHHISLLAYDWSKRITRLHMPLQKLENIRGDTPSDIPQLLNLLLNCQTTSSVSHYTYPCKISTKRTWHVTTIDNVVSWRVLSWNNIGFFPLFTGRCRQQLQE